MESVRGLSLCVTVALAAIAATAPTTPASAEQYTRASIATDGTEANGPSIDAPSISADGRYVAFSSAASNLVAGDTNNSTDIFVRDRIANTTTRVSVMTGGAERAGSSSAPRISGNGRFVVFLSLAPLVAEDTAMCAATTPTASCQDVYVHDRETGATTRVSVATDGTQADTHSYKPQISGDGRFVVFESQATTLIANDTNGNRDAFLHDRLNHTTIRMLGTPGFANHFGEPETRISDDGSTVIFSGWVAPGDVPPANDGAPPKCLLVDACPATFVYTVATGAVQVLSTKIGMAPVRSDLLLFADEPAQISANGHLLVIKQNMIVPGSNPVQNDTRFIVHDRRTGGTFTGPWRSTGLPSDIIGLSGDGRYHALLGPTTGPVVGGQHSRIVHDHVSSLDDTFSFANAPASDGDTVQVTLSATGRYVAFIARAPIVAGDTNLQPDVYVLDRDTDGDGLPTAWESRFGLNPADAGDVAGDADGDGVSNADEYARGSHPDKRFTRYLAEGAANGFMTTRLAILNPQDVTVEAAFRLLGSSGNRTTLFRTLAPHSRQTILLEMKSEPGTSLSPENDFATVIESTAPLVVDRTMTWDARRFGAHAETSVESPATEWFLAEGATHGSFDLFYLLLNPSGVDATATVKYLRPFPLQAVTKVYSVPANGRRTIWVDSEGSELAETDVSAAITSDRPIVVERSQYSSTKTQPFAAGHDGIGLTAPALTWFLAEGATGSFFDLYLLLANPGPTKAVVDVKYLLPNSVTFTKRYEVEGQSRVTLSVDFEDPRLLDTPVSMVVTSINGQPIVVERAQWWPSPNWYEAHLAAGVTTTGTVWALAEGEIQTFASGNGAAVAGDGAAEDTAGDAVGDDTKETFILIANTGTTAGSATVTLLVEDGSPITQTVALPAESRVTLSTSDLFPAGSHANFGAIIESNDVPIVVERAMYTTVAGVTWTAGTAAVATKLQ